MKRLCLTFLVLLLLIAMIPFAASAESIEISAAVDETSGDILITWDPLSIPTGYALSGILDADLYFYAPTATSEGSATFAYAFPEDGEYAFEAVFSSEGLEPLHASFTLTISTSTEPGNPDGPDEPAAPIEIIEVVWDDVFQHLTITWEPQPDLTINAININGKLFNVLGYDGSLRKVAIGELPYGRYFITYHYTNAEGAFTYTDEVHSFIVYGGDVATKLYISPDENGAPVVQVYNDKNEPIANVTVHLVAQDGEQTLVTDENGKAVFGGSYEDVLRVYSDDLQTQIALYKGQTVEVEHTTTTTSSSTTSTTQKPPKTTKPTTSTSASVTQPTTTQSYYVGAGTTGVEEDMVMLNAILDERVMALFGLSGSAFDTGARLLVSREIYQQLAEQGNGLPVMMSVFSDDRVLDSNNMYGVLDQQSEKYDKSTAYSYVIELGVVFWDAENQTAVKTLNLPYDSYVVRLPRPKNTEEHNRFYVLDMSGDQVGDYVEAVAEPEYVQVTLTNMNAVALVACEAQVSETSWRVHPLVYVFFILGGLLLLVAAAMIYLFFLYRPATANGSAAQTIDHIDGDEEPIDYNASDAEDELDEELPLEEVEESEMGDDIPDEEIEESISLGDLFNRYE